MSQDIIENERKVVIFNINNESFGVNINEIKEIIVPEELQPLPEEHKVDYIEGIMSVRGEMLIVLNLAKKLKLESKNPKDRKIMILEQNDNKIGMLVDNASEVLSISEDNIQKTPDIILEKIQSNYIEGIVNIDDRMIIIVDLLGVLKEEETIEIQKTINKKF